MMIANAANTPKSGTSAHAMDRIMQAAAQEFTRTGIDGARIENIAREAGVTKQLVYHYFNSKAELYKTVIDDAAARCLDELMALDIDHLEPVEALTAFWYRVFDQYATWPELGQIILDENIHRGEHLTARNKHVRQTPVLHQKIDHIIKRGQAAKVFKDDVNPCLFWAASIIIVTGCFVQGTTVSAALSLDLRTADGKAQWRQYSVKLILDLLRR
jgi:AcrR family transcriptional regulator